jgi:hypothetical protein
MSIHIVKKETGKEQVTNDFGPSCTQIAQQNETKQFLLTQPSVIKEVSS